MIINILVVALTVGLAGLWLSRGFYSALINLIAVVLAGGVAFAVWEPVAYMILEKTGERSFLQGAAWAIALAGPFVLAMGIFRLILDVILRANVKVNVSANYAGGAICGAAAGLISAGIIVISVGFLRLDAGLWQSDDADPTTGYLNVEYDSNGSMKRGKDLWIPADKIVASMYSSLSRTTLRNGDNTLAALYPNLAYVPTTLRYNYGMGKGRNTTRPTDFEVVARYTVGKGKNLPTPALLSDRWDPNEQRVSFFDSDSNAVPVGSHIEGFVIKFTSGAKELGGDNKVAVGNAQLRLLATKDDETITLFPIAVAAQGEAEKPAFQRFRYDGKDIFIASVGGASEAHFGFDFVLPPGFEPRFLYVKNIRHTVGEEKKPKPTDFATPADRDAAVIVGGFSGNASEPLDTSAVRVIRFDPQNTLQFPITITSSPGQVFNKMVVRMEMNDENQIIDGDQQFNNDELKSFATEKALRVETFARSSDVAIVQVEVSITKPTTWAGTAAGQEDTKAPVLVDTNGTRYEPIGFIYANSGSGLTRIRFTPAQPIRTLTGLPTLSRSKPQDTLKLIYRVSNGVKLQYFGVGGKMIVEIKPVLDVAGR